MSLSMIDAAAESLRWTRRRQPAKQRGQSPRGASDNNRVPHSGQTAVSPTRKPHLVLAVMHRRARNPGVLLIGIASAQRSKSREQCGDFLFDIPVFVESTDDLFTQEIAKSPVHPVRRCVCS